MFFEISLTATPTNVYFRPFLKWRRLFHRRASLYSAVLRGSLLFGRTLYTQRH